MALWVKFVILASAFKFTARQHHVLGGAETPEPIATKLCISGTT